MSGRPKNLDLAAFASGNYPAGANPWNGQPLRVQPSDSYFTPNVEIKAQNDNWLLGQLWDALSGLLKFVGQTPAYNWQGVTIVPSSYTAPAFIKKLVWARMDPTHTSNKKWRQGAWYAAVGDDYGGAALGNLFLFRSDDGGINWTEIVTGSLGSPSISQFNFVVLPTGDIVFPRSQDTGSGNSEVRRYSVASGSQANVAHNAASDTEWTACDARNDLVSGDGDHAGALFIGAKGGSPYTTQAAYSNADGTTWTNISANVPASLQTGGTSGARYQWFTIQSPGEILVFRTLTSETKFAQITDITAAWTERNAPTASGESAVAGCFSDELNKFFLVVQTASDTKIYSGASTSLSLASTVTGFKFTSIECLGALLLATSAGTGDAYNNDPQLIWYSIDQGVTWNKVPSMLLAWETNTQAGEAYTKYTKPTIAVAKNTMGNYQFMVYSSKALYKGLTVGLFDNVNAD